MIVVECVLHVAGEMKYSGSSLRQTPLREMKYVLIWKCPYLRGLLNFKIISFTECARLDQVVGQDGLWYHVNQFNSNRSDVIEHGLPMVCGLYYTIQTIRHQKNFYTCSHKDLSKLLCI